MFNLKCNLANKRGYQYYYNSLNGWWRSLVAHLTGGQGVAGSNPVQPTMIITVPTTGPFLFLA